MLFWRRCVSNRISSLLIDSSDRFLFLQAMESSSSLRTSCLVELVGLVGLYCFQVGLYCFRVGLIVLMVGLIVLFVNSFVLYKRALYKAYYDH